MTTPKRWPNNARQSRDDAAESLQVIIRDARRLLAHPDAAVAVRAGRIIDAAQFAVRRLIEAGAEVREDAP